jgi:ABC-type transport system involved in multi-copper enzyme maturation permease subunit
MASEPIARPLRLRRFLGANPILVKELRSRFRGPRAFVALTAFLLLLVLFAGLLYVMQVGTYQSNYGYTGQSQSMAAQIGQMLFITIAFVELACMAFVGPALTLNAISGEVERQTYDLLLATPLSGWAILRGKVGAAMAYVLLLIFSALPVMSLAFLFGGVSAQQVALSQISIFVSGLLFLMVGVFYSSLTQRTARSAVLSYLTVGAICVMPYVIIFMWSSILRFANQDTFMRFLQITPVMSLFAAVAPASWGSQGNTMVLYWSQATCLHLLTAALLYILAGARIRRVGRGAIAAMFALAFLFGLWLVWIVAAPAGWFT